jgi:hypothetical protein
MEENDDSTRPSGLARFLKAALFIGSAAAVAAIVRASLTRPWLGVAAGLAVAGFFVWRWWSHARLVRMLRRGDVNEIIAHWSDRFENIPHADTMAPLMTATAFAAFGRVKDARRALNNAAKGPAWDAALEHRLFLDAILSAFEGDRDRASEVAIRLNALPMPSRSEVRERIGSLRNAVSALVRAFSHSSEPGDLRCLESASEKSPLVHWAMRYAAAIVAVDQGDSGKARELIDGAPRWPTESAFRAFHDEIADLLTPQGG